MVPSSSWFRAVHGSEQFMVPATSYRSRFGYRFRYFWPLPIGPGSGWHFWSSVKVWFGHVLVMVLPLPVIFKTRGSRVSISLVHRSVPAQSLSRASSCLNGWGQYCSCSQVATFKSLLASDKPIVFVNCPFARGDYFRDLGLGWPLPSQSRMTLILGSGILVAVIGSPVYTWRYS